mmetsp:Transcript_13870/g.32042  ORF Transcript_13870/g.32042 Transcript_13870/m.32042 type:complete len:238 (+) Transcript_13870:577-1290(+)
MLRATTSSLLCLFVCRRKQWMGTKQRNRVRHGRNMGNTKPKKTTATVRDDTNNTRTPEKRTRQNPVGREPTKCCCCKQKQTHTHSSAVLLVDWFVAHRHSKHGGIATRKRVFRHLGCCCKACTQESPKFLARLQIACRPCRASIGPGSEIVIKLVPRQKINPNHETHNRNKRNQIETQEENSKTQQQQQQQQQRRKRCSHGDRPGRVRPGRPPAGLRIGVPGRPKQPQGPRAAGAVA